MSGILRYEFINPIYMDCVLLMASVMTTTSIFIFMNLFDGLTTTKSKKLPVNTHGIDGRI